MHELSIASSLLELSLEKAHEQAAARICKIYVTIGRLSGIEEHYLTSAFDIIKLNTCAENAELISTMQEIVVMCNDCGASFAPLELDFTCQKCKSDDFEVIQGESLMLVSLEMED